ncbi:MAG: hypothetical protein Q9217_006271 [Psora testacea]
MIAHLAMMSHPDPRKVLVIGGGDGGVLREIVKHPSVEKAVLCDIDGAVAMVSKRYLPKMSIGFKSDKVEEHIDDGLTFVQRHKNYYDVIITDSSDPEGPARKLFEKPYFKDCYDALTDGGVITTQGCSSYPTSILASSWYILLTPRTAENFWLNTDFIAKIKQDCKEVFPVVEWAWTSVPTYPSGSIGFLVATKDKDRDVKNPLRALPREEEDKLFEYYNKETHSASFILPTFARKVRCNSCQPCENCAQAGLSCTYDAIPQKKGPKGSRAKVISELRETQKRSDRAQMQNGVSSYHSLPGTPTYAPTPGLLTPELIDACAESFFVHVYPIMPILHRDQWQNVTRSMGQFVEAYCLVAALCAFMLIQPGVASHVHSPVEERSRSITDPEMGIALMEEVGRVRKAYDYIENPTVQTVIISFFLFGSSFGLNKHNAAWFHLREATAFTQLLGMQDENTYSFGNVVENARKRRLFWLLAYALQKHRPLTLHATIGLPTVDADSSASTTGFIHLVNLYQHFDDTFIGLWNKSRTDCSTFWLAQLQQQLTEVLPAYIDTTESQAADLGISQQWLRTIVWQLSITNGYLSVTSPDSAMTFGYPIEIAKDLVAVTQHLSKPSMEVHGIGLIEKVFDITCTLIDVMSCVSSASNNQQSPQQYLNQLLVLISTLRGGESRFLPLVMAKIRNTNPVITNQLPTALVGRAAAGSLVNGSALSPPDGIDGLSGINRLNGISGSVMNGLNALARQRDGYIKQEPTSGSSGKVSANVSDAGSPYSTPPFLHYYPLV